jgi:hypothetical protein
VPDGIVTTQKQPDGSYLTTVIQGGPLDGWTLPTPITGRDEAAVRKTARRVHLGAVAMAREMQLYGTAQ